MQKKKPDIFLGITMGMLVLAAVLCLVILIAQKSAKSKTNTNPAASGSEVIGSDVVNPSNNTPDASNPEGSEPNASDSGPVNPDPGPVDVSAIDEVGLKAALDDCLSGLPNDWQVVVIDPIVGTEVDSQINAGGVDEWMKADGMPVVFIMGAAFQKVADGELTEDQILEDCTLMIVNNDAAAGDRLTKLVGGMDAVKSFATANDLAILMQMLLSNGEYGGIHFLKPETVRLFTSQQFENNRRGLVFDKPVIDTTLNGTPSKRASRASYGHTGFTGPFVWADPQNKLILVFLTNSLYPNRSMLITKLDLRTKIHDVFYAEDLVGRKN